MTIGDIMTTASFHDCCSLILRHCPNQYAKGYARAGLTLHGSEAQRVQCLYLLNNIKNWRGDVAKAVRAALKHHGKVS